MEEMICKRVLYINKIYQNLTGMRLGEIKGLFRAINRSNLLFLDGEGRSLSAIVIGMRGIKKDTLARNDTSFHWRNIKDAAPDLGMRYGRVAVIVNTGSGGTPTPRQTVEDLKEYIDKTGDQRFTISTVTSTPNSQTAKKSHVVVRLKGREEEIGVKAAPSELGIMGDMYELASLLFFQEVKEAINQRQSFEQIPKEIEKEMVVVGRSIDEYLDSKEYSDLVEEASSRSRIIIGGLGPGREVARMTAIRTRHIKQMTGGNAFLAGPFAPPPRPGDVLLLISFSGETKPVLQWCRDYKTAGSRVFSIVGNKSTLSEESESYLIKAPVEQFYERAAFLLSPLPGGILEIFKKYGIEIPETIIRSFAHTVTE